MARTIDEMDVTIRVMAWNVRRAAYGQIARIVEDEDPDILVLSETVEPTERDRDLLGASDMRWRGLPGGPGVAVLSFRGRAMSDGREQPPVPPGFKAGPDTDAKGQVLPWVLPVEIDVGLSSNLRVVGAWPSNRKKLRPLSIALCRWRDWLSGGPAIVAGDFNHHRKWDLKRRPLDPRNHAYTEHLLDEHNLVSAFHTAHGVSDPTDEPATMWTAFDQSKGHHIDYVYAPEPCVIRKPGSVRIGTWADVAATRLSDHAPIICDLAGPSESSIIGCTFDEDGPAIVRPYWSRPHAPWTAGPPAAGAGPPRSC